MLNLFGAAAVTLMMVMYALERRGPGYVLAFAGGCLLASAYGFLAGAWPFGVVELVWAGGGGAALPEPGTGLRSRLRDRPRANQATAARAGRSATTIGPWSIASETAARLQRSRRGEGSGPNSGLVPSESITLTIATPWGLM